MRFSLHPHAQASFDVKADSILALVQQKISETEPSVGDFLALNGVPMPVEVMWESLQDSDIRTGVAFPLLERAIRIEGNEFLPIVHLAEKIQQRRELSEAVSIQAILDVLVMWLKQRVGAEMDGGFSQFLLNWIEQNATERTVIFPIFQVWCAGVLKVAGVEIRTVEDADVNRWYEQLLRNDEWRQHAQRERDEWRNRIGGRAAAFVAVTAEPTQALELAYEKVDRVLSIIRSFSPAMLTPTRRSFCTVYGMEQIRKRTAFSIGPDALPNLSEVPLDGVTHWLLDETELRELAEQGFVNAIALLEDAAPMRFRNEILDSLILYSRASTETRVESKLLHIFSAVETLLLKNADEPILATVSRRFAYVVGGDMPERRAVRSRFLRAYSARSEAVHHGKGIDDHVMLKEFMWDAWRFFRGVVFKAADYASKQEYIDAIEEAMLAGPPLANG